ncbi:hypothetical protein OK074_0662, partial [Actinobacteria bacterium OK074]
MSRHQQSDQRPLNDVAGVTADGAAWLASAGTYPRSTLAFWEERPTAPVVLPCGTAFDVVSAPAVFGRRMLDRLLGEGPGSGPVAVHRGRTLLFATPGTARRLPALLEWEEWGNRGRPRDASAPVAAPGLPPLLCHGTGDAVTVPAPAPPPPPTPQPLTHPRPPPRPGPHPPPRPRLGRAPDTPP